MTKQRNEPSDPAAELAEYDLTNSDGTSPDDKGTIETTQWPVDTPKKEFRESGHDIVPKWVQSFYSTPNQSNIAEFSQTIDNYTEDPIRYNVLKASQNKIKKAHLRPSERLAIAALAYEDTDDIDELVKKYGLSKTVFNYSKYAFDRIIEAENVTEKQLQSEIEQYEAETSTQAQNDQPNEQSDYEKHKDELRDYLLQHMEQPADKVIEETGFNVSKHQVNGLRANLVRHGHVTEAEQGETAADEQTNTDPKTITIELEFEKQNARETVMSKELSTDMRERIVDLILQEVGL